MPEIDKLYYINVGPKGTFQPSGDLHTVAADIDALLKHIKDNNINKLAVHFHGGLISEVDGAGIAEKLIPVYQDADAHPIVFIWETGLMETLSRNLDTIQKTKLAKKLLKYLIKHLAQRIGGGIGDKGPGEAMSLEEIEAELQNEGAFDQYDVAARGAAGSIDEDELDAVVDEIQADLEIDLEADEEIETLLTEAPETELLSPELLGDIQSAQSKGILSALTVAKYLAKIAFQVLKRYLVKRDHGFYPTIVEELLRELYLADFGAWVWSGMKSVAQDMWKPNNGPITEDGHVGGYFLAGLSALQQERPDLIVDLVGHSAGTIAICHLLDANKEQGLNINIRNVLFLAAACTSDLFYEQIVDHPEYYQRFRMFTMNDDNESKDRLVPGLYTRSLLYFISGVLEDEADKPIAGMERHAKGEFPYDGGKLPDVSKFLLETEKKRIVLSKTTTQEPGLQSHAVSHGDFDDDSQTRNSLKAIITE